MALIYNFISDPYRERAAQTPNTARAYEDSSQGITAILVTHHKKKRL